MESPSWTVRSQVPEGILEKLKVGAPKPRLPKAQGRVRGRMKKVPQAKALQGGVGEVIGQDRLLWS